MDTLWLRWEVILTTVAGSAFRVGFLSAEAMKSSAFMSWTGLSSPVANLQGETQPSGSASTAALPRELCQAQQQQNPEEFVDVSPCIVENSQ